MDSILKIVYDNWYDDAPIPNGVPNSLIPYLQKNLNGSDNVKLSIKQLFNCGDIFIFRGHDQFSCYFNHNIISSDDIKDDDAIYLYPVEIRTVLSTLYENHTCIVDGKPVSYSFKDTLSPLALKYLKLGKLSLIINLIVDPISNSHEIRAIEHYMNSLGIDGSNIIIICGNDYNKEYSKLEPTSRIKLYEGAFLIQQAAQQMANYPTISDLGYESNNVKLSNLNSQYVRNKKFLCFNRQLNWREQKVIMAYFAIKHNLLKDNIFSFISTMKYEDIVDAIKKLYPAGINDLSGIAKKIYDLLPYEIDTQSLTKDEKTGFGVNNNKQELYLDTYIHLTMETRFLYGDTPFLSEKTFRPIVNLQPFLYFGNHHALEKLHDLGFKTFHPWIDESYDLEIDPRKRILMLERELVKLNNKSINEIHDWYYSITDILLHNQANLEKFKDTNPYTNFLKDIL